METPYLQRGALNFYPDPVEPRGQVIDVETEPTGNRTSSIFQRKAAAFNRWHEPDKSRGLRPDL